MSATICGRDSEMLRSALRILTDADSDDGARVAIALADLRGLQSPRVGAMRDLLDPAKVAEMLAEALRAHGVAMMFVGIATENVIHAHVGPTMIHRLLMFQARAMLLRLSLLPADAPTVDVLRALDS